MNGPLRATEVLWVLITRQGRPEAPSEHEPLALPLATETKRQGKADSPLRGGGGGVCLCIRVTGFDLAETEKPPRPIKGFFRESHKYRGLIFKRAVVMASKWRKWLPCLASKPRDR